MQYAFDFGSVEFKQERNIPLMRFDAKEDAGHKAFIHENAFWETENLKSAAAFARLNGGSEEEREKFLLLNQILLSIGGRETVFYAVEEDMDAILTRGLYYKGTSKMMRGRDNRCHSNVCDLWEQNHKDKDVSIATGYALSDDGLWRQHSWLVHRYQTATQRRTRIVETTVKRVCYFGFEMTDAEAERFCQNNY